MEVQIRHEGKGTRKKCEVTHASEVQEQKAFAPLLDKHFMGRVGVSNVAEHLRIEIFQMVMFGNKQDKSPKQGWKRFGF